MLDIKTLVENFLITEDNKYSYFAQLYRDTLQQNNEKHQNKEPKTITDNPIVPFKEINGSNYQIFDHKMNQLYNTINLSNNNDVERIIEQWYQISFLLDYTIINPIDDYNAKNEFYHNFYRFINNDKTYYNYMKDLKDKDINEWENHYNNLTYQLNDFYNMAPQYFKLNLESINKKLKRIPFFNNLNKSLETLDLNAIKNHEYKIKSGNLNTSNDDNKIKDKIEVTHAKDLGKTPEQMVYEKYPKDEYDVELLGTKQFANNRFYLYFRRLKDKKKV